MLVLIGGRLGAGVECQVEPSLFSEGDQESDWGGKLDDFLNWVGPNMNNGP